MEGFSANRGYNDESHPFLPPSYLGYSPDPYGYYPVPYSYPYEHIPPDPAWPSVYSTNPYMMPHSAAMDMGYMPSLGIPAYVRMSPGRGRNFPKGRAYKKSRSSQPAPGTQGFTVPNDRSYSEYQTPHPQNGYMMRAPHEWTQTVHPMPPTRQLNPYACPYQHRGVSATNLSKGNPSKDILSEAMKESGIGNMDSSPQFAVSPETAKGRDLTFDTEFRDLYEPVGMYGMDMTRDSFISREKDFTSSLCFPEPRQFEISNSTTKAWDATTHVTAAQTSQNNNSSMVSTYGNCTTEQNRLNTTGQVVNSTDLMKQPQPATVLAGSSSHHQNVPIFQEGVSQLPNVSSISTDGSKKNTNAKETLGFPLYQNENTPQTTNFAPVSNYGNAGSSLEMSKQNMPNPGPSPPNACKDSLDALDLFDMPTLEDIALDFNDDNDGMSNNISIESLINTVNEYCQLDGSENAVGSYYLTDLDGKIVFQLREGKDNCENVITPSLQDSCEQSVKAANSGKGNAKLYENQVTNCHNGKDSSHFVGMSSVGCLDENTTAVHPAVEFLNLTDADRSANKQIVFSRADATAVEDIASNSVDENRLNQQETAMTTLISDITQDENLSNKIGVNNSHSQFEPEYHSMSFTVEDHALQLVEHNTSYKTIPERLVDRVKLADEIFEKAGNLQCTEICKPDVQNGERKIEPKENQADKSNQKLEHASEESTARSKAVVNRDNDDASQEGGSMEPSNTEKEKFPSQCDISSDINESESLRYLRAFIRNFENLNEEEEDMMVTVNPNQVLNPVHIEDNDLKRMGEDIFHASVVEMASLCDATDGNVEAASEILLQSAEDKQEQGDVEVIGDVGSVQTLPKQEAAQNSVTLSVQMEDFRKLLFDVEEGALQNDCKMSETCDKDCGQRCFVDSESGYFVSNDSEENK